MKKFTFTHKKSNPHHISHQPNKHNQQANNQQATTLNIMSESQEGNGVILVDLEVPYLNKNMFFLIILNFVERRTAVSFTVGTWDLSTFESAADYI